MRYGRQNRRWKVRTAAVLAVLFLMVGGRACTAGKGDETQQISWRQQLELGMLDSAVGLLSPPLRYAWKWAEEERKANAVIEEQAASIEVLLLEEQKRSEGGPVGTLSTGELSTEGEPMGASAGGETMAPEDQDEWQQAVTEWDADLLAEIDRENEAMRQQAEWLQNQQAQQTGEQSVSAGTQAPQDGQQGGLPSLDLPYTMEQLKSLEFLTETLYNVNKSTTVSKDLLDAATLLSMDMKLQDPGSDGPKVLIHHTHATEYFADSNAKDEATLIVGVGDYLEELLETRYGIEVLHDRTVYPYNEAYSRALEHVEQILAENPTIEVFIDLHRDAGGTKKYTVSVDGKETANLMFFNGLSYSANGPIDYLPNKNQQANLAFSFQMKMAGDSLYPGLCKRNYLKAYRYNLHVLPRAVIVEVGDNNNTLQEAKNAMEPLARILNYVLTGEY